MKQQKRRRRRRQDTLVLKLLILVTLVLVVFEGRLIVTMFSHHSQMTAAKLAEESNGITAVDGTITESESEESKDADAAPAVTTGDSASPDAFLAGLPTNLGTPSTGSSAQSDRLPTVSNPDSAAIVPKTDPPVDDSYFADAVFIGDSRMEGFRNASGITQGRFFTSVGMSLSSMTKDAIIQTADGNITVAAALSGGVYNKIYIMLGTNDLGEYDWNSFRDGFISVTQRFLEIQPDAILYVCSVLYVEESKVDSTQYVNNANVDKINSILLEVCEQEGYHYLDLNEFLSNGYGSLIEGATSDGVHIYPDYCKQMLTYLKSHYVPVEEPDETEAETETETESESEDSEVSV